MHIEVIEDNPSFLIINKPPGLTVHRGDLTPKDELTLVDFILKEYPEIREVGEKNRPGIVHRLDKETSGIMIIARNQEAYRYFVGMFQDQKINKEYLALVYGKVKEPRGEIVYSITRSKKNYSKFAIGPGREAKTSFEVLKYCLDPKNNREYTLLKASPKTGRTHQLRVHFKAIGHPIVSDQKYRFKNQRKINPLSRLFLHASKIVFIDPRSKQEKAFEAPLEKELKEYLATLICSSPSEGFPEAVPQQ